MALLIQDFGVLSDSFGFSCASRAVCYGDLFEGEVILEVVQCLRVEKDCSSGED